MYFLRQLPFEGVETFTLAWNGVRYNKLSNATFFFFKKKNFNIYLFDS